MPRVTPLPTVHILPGGGNMLLALLLILVGGMFGCSTAGASPSSPKITVSASILPLGDFCRQIGGDRVDVQVLIPPGASPHVFEPPPSVMARASRARIFFYIGAGLEPWAEKLLHSRDIRNLEIVAAARGVPLLGSGDHHQEGSSLHQAHTHGPGKAGERARPHHPPGAGNPHIWLDPVLAQAISRQIAAAFIRVDPEHRRVYEANLQRFLAALEELHQDIQQRSRAWSVRAYVSFHPAFTYFAQRYGLREVGVIEAAPGREPTPRHLREMVTAIRQSGIRVVFAEPQFNPRIAAVLAQEAGVKVLTLDPVGGRPPYGSDYLEMMRYNLGVMEEAMK